MKANETGVRVPIKNATASDLADLARLSGIGSELDWQTMSMDDISPYYDQMAEQVKAMTLDMKDSTMEVALGAAVVALLVENYMLLKLVKGN